MNVEEKVILYIDNSNIFINAQKHSALKRKFLKCVQDRTCRIDVGALTRIANNNRLIIHGKLYGSEPPALDSVWRAIRERKIEVHRSEKSAWNLREKRVDTELVAAAIDDINELKEEAGDYRTIILFTGDEDMIPVVHRALKHKWKVEVWSFKVALKSKYYEITKQSDNVKIFFIDDFFDKFTFQQLYFNGPIPGKSIVLR